MRLRERTQYQKLWQRREPSINKGGRYMLIAERGGHSPNCKGAIGIVDEQVEVRKISGYLEAYIENYCGVTAIDCNNDECTEYAELAEGTRVANAYNADEFFSVHMNAFNGSAHGAEIWLYPETSDQIKRQAWHILNNLEHMGFSNRGVKYSSDLHDLNATAMPAAIALAPNC